MTMNSSNEHPLVAIYIKIQILGSSSSNRSTQKISKNNPKSTCLHGCFMDVSTSTRIFPWVSEPPGDPSSFIRRWTQPREQGSAHPRPGPLRMEWPYGNCLTYLGFYSNEYVYYIYTHIIRSYVSHVYVYIYTYNYIHMCVCVTLYLSVFQCISWTITALLNDLFPCIWGPEKAYMQLPASPQSYVCNLNDKNLFVKCVFQGRQLQQTVHLVSVPVWPEWVMQVLSSCAKDIKHIQKHWEKTT